MLQLRSIELLALLLYAASTVSIVLGILAATLGKGELRAIGLVFAGAGTITAGVITLLSYAVKIPSGASLIDVNLTSLAQAASGIVLPLAAGLVLVVALAAGTLAMHRRGHHHLVWAAPMTFGTTSFAGILLMINASLAQTTVIPAQSASGIAVPRGFQITHYYDRALSSPTALAFGPDGNLYVALYAGKIVVLHRAQNTKQASELTVFASGLDRPVALAWHGSDLFVAQAGKITVMRDTAQRGRANEMKDLVTGLPAYVYPLHANFGLAFGPDGRLYFGVGATTNASAEQNPMAARIWSVNPDGSDLREVASGVRNTFGLAFNTAGDLFETDNGPNWEGAAIGDELKWVVNDGRYGFPNFGMPRPNDDWRAPTAIFPPHVSADGIAFYPANPGSKHAFPGDYWGDAFVSFWNTGQLARVRLAKLPDGTYTAAWSLFAQGLNNPLGVTTDPDGSLLVADFGTGTIYSISANPLAANAMSSPAMPERAATSH